MQIAATVPPSTPVKANFKEIRNLAASQAPLATMSDMENVAKTNPQLQFVTAGSVQEEVGVLFTNTAQLGNKNGDTSSLEPFLKELGIERPSPEDLGSPEGLKKVQAQVQKALHSVPDDKVNAIEARMRTQFDQLVHAAGASKGSFVSPSA
jgi:hypothetical protein